MRRSTAIGLSAAATAVVTYGAVFAAVHFSPVSAYDEPFRRILVAVERLWSYAHGWQPMSHLQEFGSVYAPLVQFGCPLLGFSLFRMLSRRPAGGRLWLPLSVAAVLTLPSHLTDGVSSDAIPWVEAGRAALVLAMMAWSVEARRPKWRCMEPSRRDPA